MKTFLLIHGGSHGAWCWDAVITELQQQGHKAYAIDIPGSGEDHTPRETVTVGMCIERIIGFIDAEGLEDVVLVGHSLAGLYLPTVADRRREKISEVIFVAGVVLDVGERCIDFIPEDRRSLYQQMANESSDNSLAWSFEITRKVFFADLDNPEKFHAKLTPQALGPYLELATISPICTQPTRYILCRGDKALLPETCEAFARKLDVKPAYIDSGHDVMLSQAKALAVMLSN